MWKEDFVFGCDFYVDLVSPGQILVTYKSYSGRDRILNREYIDVYLK